MTGVRGPVSQADSSRKLTGDAGKRAPRTSRPDPGDTSRRTPAASGTTASAAGGPTRAPQAPRWLMPEALAEWRRVVPMLRAAGHLEASDVPVIAMYCTAWAQWRALDAELAASKNHVMHCPECGIAVGESAYLVEGARGNLVKTPLWQMWRDAGAQVERLAKQLGLSPEGRLRLPAAPPAPTKSDPLSGFGATPGAGDGEQDDTDDDE